MACFITGDTHGDFTRFKEDIFYEQAELNREDYVIICGDLGGIWDRSPKENKTLDWLDRRPFTTLFVSGNHENFDALREYPVLEWHGGKVQQVRPGVLHLMRGQVYDINGKRFFTMGGASSHDIQDGILEPDDRLFKQKFRKLSMERALFRVNHRSWWKEELPSETEYEEALANLDKAGWEVDYIITHCCPTSVQDVFSGGLFQKDALTDFFDEIRRRCQFKYWFFGHYHENMVIEKSFVMLYEQIIRLK